MLRIVSYATSRFRLRQQVLHQTALLSGAVEEASSWNRKKLERYDFEEACPALRLDERGGGWWAWKPFIILKELEAMTDGQWLLYCDVGRLYPFKVVDRPLGRLIAWAEDRQTHFVPGVRIPWNGPMSRWTKRDAFVLTDSDAEKFHTADPIQASFSLWKACPESRAFVAKWLMWSADRRLITDDVNTCHFPNLPDFQEHRHDQSLLSLLCLREGRPGLDLGTERPLFDEKNPAAVAAFLGEPPSRRLMLRIVLVAARWMGWLELGPRRFLSLMGWTGSRLR